MPNQLCICHRRQTGLNVLSIASTIILGVTLCFTLFESFLDDFADSYDFNRAMEFKCIALACFIIGTIACVTLGAAAWTITAWYIVPCLISLPLVFTFCIYDLTMRCIETEIIEIATSDIISVFDIANRGIMIHFIILNILFIPFAFVLALFHWFNIRKVQAQVHYIKQRDHEKEAQYGNAERLKRDEICDYVPPSFTRRKLKTIRNFVRKRRRPRAHKGIGGYPRQIVMRVERQGDAPPRRVEKREYSYGTSFNITFGKMR